MNYEPIIAAFADLAVAYCAWAEGNSTPDNEHYRATQFVAKLYLAGLELPVTEAVSNLDAPSLSIEEYKEIHKRFGVLPFQYYWEVFNPQAEPPEEPVAGDICEDLADIYRDLKEGLFYWEKGQKQDAVFCWKFAFGVHWGRHATGALRALHCFESFTSNDEK